MQCWQLSHPGAAGDGTLTEQPSPVRVVGPGGTGTLDGAAQLAAGDAHSLALRRDGTVWAWGQAGVHHQLGAVEGFNRPFPVQSRTPTGVTAVAAGDDHSLALRPARLTATTYEYDRLHRLTAATDQGVRTAYSYDPVGNRLSRRRAAVLTEYGYDKADRIDWVREAGIAPVDYTVDPNGNLIQKGLQTFGYDRANRLTAAQVGVNLATYSYDGDGKRVSTSLGGVLQTGYLYDVNGGLPVVLEERRPEGVRRFVWGLGLAYAEGPQGQLEVFHQDGLGSVRAVTDQNAVVVQTYETDAFGVPEAQAGTSTQPMQYAGEQRDPETGFVYLRARTYDPQIGRFLQRDPFAGAMADPLTLNRYSYVLNNPINLVDPSGNKSMVLDGNEFRVALPWICWIMPSLCLLRPVPEFGQEATPTPGPTPVPARLARMRVQLQRSPLTGGITTETIGAPLDASDPPGVTSEQVIGGLDAVFATGMIIGMIPNAILGAATAAYDRVVDQVRHYAATGGVVASPYRRTIIREEFPTGGYRRSIWRFEVENFAGHNLRS